MTIQDQLYVQRLQRDAVKKAADTARTQERNDQINHRNRMDDIKSWGKRDLARIDKMSSVPAAEETPVYYEHQAGHGHAAASAGDSLLVAFGSAIIAVWFAVTMYLRIEHPIDGLTTLLQCAFGAAFLMVLAGVAIVVAARLATHPVVWAIAAAALYFHFH